MYYSDMETPHIPTMLSFQPHPALSMPQMPSFHQQLQGPTQAQQDATDRARAYKSRNKRPCDFCRYKKAACHLDNQPPCELCIRYNKECTFVESPAKRRRPNDSSGSELEKSNGGYEPHTSGGTPFLNGGAVDGGGMDIQHGRS